MSQLGSMDGNTLPQSAPRIEFARDTDLTLLLSRHKLSREEFEKILKIIGRQPTLTELGVFSAMWSEHCSYKSSKVHIKRFPTKGERVVVGPGENAGVVQIEGDLCVAFKMESHNHPSYIEPYQGAATGVGGILRDVFCMGARPIANLNCLRFGSRVHTRTPHLLERVVKGIGDYGNCVGIPTVGGSVSFDETYDNNCLVNAMTVGLIRREKIFKGLAAGVGNLVVYVGSATGRDGIHGATMASDSFAGDGSTTKTTVQVGDPFAEKLLMEATLEVLDKNLVIGIQDMGAAGLTSSSFEMAGRAGNGVFISLDKVPLRAREMTAYEIMLSESQERMLMVVEPSKWAELSKVLSRWQLPYAIIGHVTNTGRMQIEFQGWLEVDLPVAPLTDEAPVYQKIIGPEVIRKKVSSRLDCLKDNLQTNSEFSVGIFKKMLCDVGSKRRIYEQFDRHVGTKTIMDSETGGAAVMWVRHSTTETSPFLGVALSGGCNQRRVFNNPHIGAAEAVLDCAREVLAVGGQPIAITDCLNFGNADDPAVMRQLSDSVDGISEACIELDTPVVSGNVSLYNATKDVSIYPTPMIGVVGIVKDIRCITPACIKNVGDFVLCELTGKSSSAMSLAASLAAKNASISADEGSISAIDWREEKAVFKALQVIRQTGQLVAARPVAEGGLGVAIFKMADKIIPKGVDINVFVKDAISYFGEGGSRFLICLDKAAFESAQVEIQNIGLSLNQVGNIQIAQTFGSQSESAPCFGTLTTYFTRVNLKDLYDSYNRSFDCEGFKC